MIGRQSQLDMKESFVAVHALQREEMALGSSVLSIMGALQMKML